ncbi:MULTISPECIES: glycosyltransferase family 4 protein [Amycolatopsis]|uniref:glycosyltransferase family 4 protein n=1 Tax=Amycolatopsis TaxID=1813 RepID=UPI000B8B643B|nr:MULTISPECIES: glycosyltransferase family 4 protein [Amycolatopsis]OXM74312.1 glycosyl transferase family 1 [Amycolatopsis sp. KNN50.9b]
MNTAAGLVRPGRPVGHLFELRGWVTAGETVTVHIGASEAEVRRHDTGTEPPGTTGLLIRTPDPVPTGRHEVVVRAANGDALTSAVVEVGRFGDEEPLRLYEIDTPKHGDNPQGDVVFVRGWVLLDSRAPSLVEVLVDGGEPIRARTRLPRPDVADHLPDFPDAGVSGFEARVPIDLPAGEDRALSVRVRVRGELSGEWTSEAREVVLSNPAAEDSDVKLAAHLAERTRAALTRPRGATDPRHVLVFTHSLAVGGGQLWLQELLDRLATRHGWRITVITQLDGELRADCEAHGIDVHLTSPYRVHDVASYEGHIAELAQFARGTDASVALVNTLGAFPGADAAIRAGLPTAWVLHESFDLNDFSYQNWGPAGLLPPVRDRWVSTLREADRLLFVADATREMFLPFSSPARCRTIRYGTPMVTYGGQVSERDRRAARRKLGIPEDTTLLLNVGVLEPRKGQGLLISAMDRVRRAHPGIRLSIVGHHPSPYGLALAEFTERAGLTDWVDLVPIQRDPAPWFEAADMFVNSSDVESLPRSILEAVCCGLPVVASDVFGAREMITDGHSGWLFEPNDADALTVALLRALDTPADRRRAIAAAAYEKLHGWLDPAGYAAEYADVLTELVKERG